MGNVGERLQLLSPRNQRTIFKNRSPIQGDSPSRVKSSGICQSKFKKFDKERRVRIVYKRVKIVMIDSSLLVEAIIAIRLLFPMIGCWSEVIREELDS